MFPPGYFYIISRKHGYALDVFNGETKSDVNIIVWPQKFQDSDNQLWSFDNGRLINKKSGLALDTRTSAFKRDKVCIQYKIKDSHQTQQWGFDDGFIHSMVYPSMVLDIKGDSEEGGAQVLLYNRKETDNLNQLWFLEPYEQFESSLTIAEDAGPLHKKPGFGQPRLGYGAEIGIPPALESLPEDIKVAGVNDNQPTSSVDNQPSSTNPESAQPSYPPQPESEDGSQPPPLPSYPPSYPPHPSGGYPSQPQQQGDGGYSSYPQPPQPYGLPPQQTYNSPPSQYGYPPPQQQGSFTEPQYQYGDYNVFSRSDYQPQQGGGPYGTGYPSGGGGGYQQQGGGYPPPPGGAGGFYPPPPQQNYQYQAPGHGGAPSYPPPSNYSPYPPQ